MRFSRYWLALLYLLATVLVQGVHLHGLEEATAASQHEAGCDDPRPHVAGHESPDLSHAQDHCPACQFRAHHQVCLFDPLDFVRPGLVRSRGAEASPVSTASLLRDTCRAPPGRDAA